MGSEKVLGTKQGGGGKRTKCPAKQRRDSRTSPGFTQLERVMKEKKGKRGGRKERGKRIETQKKGEKKRYAKKTQRNGGKVKTNLEYL